uniref:Uncharacterized protein n=1 Tax=Bartonella schoenbuchensis (strain DSM 13525 / NCTC 13165 / R1) TaxID=687861 RepID=E6Z1K9_BARSR|nr:hypothetical protein BARSC_190270 [Bartonella schoenbuchensis R1]
MRNDPRHQISDPKHQIFSANRRFEQNLVNSDHKLPVFIVCMSHCFPSEQ